ncbi:MAG: hypothetical protein QOE90_2845 [Thermoplasmata archaeon]|nr:hypothetical protein [Thermoplasmata archaeon]
MLRTGLAHVVLYDFPDETPCLACGSPTRMRVAFSSGALFTLCATCRRGGPT